MLQFPKYTNTGITRLSLGLYPWVRLHLMWNVELNTFDDCASLPFIWGFRDQYPWLVSIRKHTKADTTWTLDLLCIWVRPHLAWNIEFNTFDDFLYMTLSIWGISAQSPQIISIPQIPYNRWPSDDPETWVRPHLMRILGSVFLICPNVSNTLKCVELLNRITFGFEQGLSKPN